MQIMVKRDIPVSGVLWDIELCSRRWSPEQSLVPRNGRVGRRESLSVVTIDADPDMPKTLGTFRPIGNTGKVRLSLSRCACLRGIIRVLLWCATVAVEIICSPHSR